MIKAHLQRHSQLTKLSPSQRLNILPVRKPKTFSNREDTMADDT